MTNKFKIGDKVRLLGQTSDRKNHYGWDTAMDELVGQIVIIQRITNIDSRYIADDGFPRAAILVPRDGKYSATYYWYWDVCCLELICCKYERLKLMLEQ